MPVRIVAPRTLLCLAVEKPSHFARDPMTTPELAHPLALPQRRGLDLLHDPRFNKGTAFTRTEREALGLRGLLPPGVFDEEAQLHRNIQALRRKASDFERYQVLSALAERNQTLFFRLLSQHLQPLGNLLVNGRPRLGNCILLLLDGGFALADFRLLAGQPLLVLLANRVDQRRRQRFGQLDFRLAAWAYDRRLDHGHASPGQ